MPARLIRRTDPLGRALPEQWSPIKVVPRRVLRRRQEVHVAGLLVDVQHADHVELATGHAAQRAAIARDEVQVTPAVALADPGEGVPLLNTLPVIVVNVHPGSVALGVNRSHLPGCGIGEHHVGCILKPVHAANEQFLRIAGPIHARDVEVGAGVAGNVHPEGLASARRDDADAAGRVPFARLRVGEGLRDRVGSARVVEQRELLDAARVELPVRDLLAVGAPPPAVAAEELFLVDPIEGAVDDVVRTVAGELRRGAALGRFHEEIVLANVPDSRAIG